MKTFKQLTVGDIIYRLEKTSYSLVPENDRGSIYNPTVLEKHTIKKINLDDGVIYFEKVYQYQYLKINANEADIDTILVDDRYLFFSNEDAYKKQFADFLVERIKDSENNVKKAKEDSEKLIQSIREYYWEILNPLNCKY